MLRSCSHYKYTGYTGTRGLGLFLPAGSRDEKQSIPPSPARCWQRDVPRTRATGLGTSCPVPPLNASQRQEWAQSWCCPIAFPLAGQKAVVGDLPPLARTLMEGV